MSKIMKQHRLPILARLPLALVLAAGTGLFLPTAARAETPTQLTDLHFSWSGGLLQRTQVQFVTVSLTLVDPDGIPPSGYQGHATHPGAVTCPCVKLQNVNVVEPRSRTDRPVSLHLTSGTNTAGVWTGRFALGAADAGFWRPVAMMAGDFQVDTPFGVEPVAVPAPWNQVTINVRGYDWPRAWLGTPVASGSRFVVHGGVGLTRSGLPVGGLRLEIWNQCGTDVLTQLGTHGFRTAVRTDPRGHYAYAVTASQLKANWGGVCAAWVAYPTDTVSMVLRSNIRTHA